MATEEQHREEPYRPPDGTFHKATNVLPDKWGRCITRSLGASHAWVLTIAERLVIGYQCKARRVSVSDVARLSGLGRERVYEVLADLEATGVISLRDRRRGRPPLIAFDLDWRPTPAALGRGEQVKRTRIEQKASSAQGVEEGDVSATAGNQEEDELSATDDNQVASHGGQPELSTTAGNQLSAAASNNIQSDTEGASLEAYGSYPDKGSAHGQASLFDRKYRKTTPPSSSSSSSVGSTNPGERRDSSDDDKGNPPSESRVEAGEQTRVGGETSSKAAARTWQAVADYIREIPLERITDEARELGNALEEKVPRLGPGLVTRLSLYCIETSSVSHLGAVVCAQRQKLKFKVDNPYSYLVKVLFPFPEADAGVPDASPAGLFETAYLRGETHRTLRGIASRHQFEGVERTRPIPTEDYFEEFRLPPEEEAEFQRRWAEREKKRQEVADGSKDAVPPDPPRGRAARQPTDDLIERL